MNIKNTVSLTISEAVELLSKIADSLEHQGEFAFDLKGQEVSIEAGKQLQAQLSISPDQFSMIFDWGEDVSSSASEQQTQEQKAEEKEFHEPPQMIKEVNLPEEEEKPQKPKQQIQVEEATPVPSGPRRALPDRMPLNTSTLPLEAGYWAPAFTADEEAQWQPVAIEGELENKKWASEDQITTLSDLTPSSAKPKKARAKKSEDEDLFSELDKLDEPSKPRAGTTEEKVEKVEIPQGRSARPAGEVANIPQPSSKPNIGSVPGSVPESTPQSSAPESAPQSSAPKSAPQSSAPESAPQSSAPESAPQSPPPSAKSSIPRPNKETSRVQSSSPPVPQSSGNQGQNEDWREPQPEDNVSNDDWVRPSEILKKKNRQNSATTGKPQASTSQSEQPKRESIPKPSKEGEKGTQSSGTSKVVDDVKEWREPSADDNTTDDDWVKPSEFLKRSKQTDQESEEQLKDNQETDPVNRPPPRAPDSDDEDKKKKGWASWD